MELITDGEKGDGPVDIPTGDSAIALAERPPGVTAELSTLGGLATSGETG